MVCDKCGTEVTMNDKFCPKCGAEVEKQEKKRSIKGNKKLYIVVAIILALVVVLAVFKYNALIVLSILAIVAVAVVINRKILKIRKKNKADSIEEYRFSDTETKKFSGYFVNREEKYISSLGNGYIMNFFANGSLRRGFAIISDKRVYFRGSCFSGQGKTLVKTDEERTVDIKDITGSGFMYRRFLGILIALFMALVTLVCGIGGSVCGAVYSWTITRDTQERVDEAAKKLDDIKNGEEIIENLKEQIAENEEELQELDIELQEVNALQKKSVAESLSVEELQGFLADTELQTAYEDYLRNLQSIFNNSNAGYYLKSLYNCAKEVETYLAPSDADYTYIMNRADDIINFYESYERTMNENRWVEDYGYLEFWCIDPETYLRFAAGGIWDDSFITIFADAYGRVAYAEAYNMGDYGYYGYYSLYCLWSWGEDYIDYDCITKMTNELSEPFTQAHRDFMNEIAPENWEQDNLSFQEIILSYVKEHPDSVLNNSINLEELSSEYDDDIQAVTTKIDNLKSKNQELYNEIESLVELMSKERSYQEQYESNKKESFGYYVLTTVASGFAALLATFLISCVLTFAEYLKKRKTLFEIQYAGGRIAFDVSYYAKAEIDDFQKQLRRAKDFAEETATVRTVTVESPAQAPVQAPPQSSVPDDLRKYADLLKEGLISQEEYDAMKKKILGL